MRPCESVCESNALPAVAEKRFDVKYLWARVRAECIVVISFCSYDAHSIEFAKCPLPAFYDLSFDDVVLGHCPAVSFWKPITVS